MKRERLILDWSMGVLQGGLESTTICDTFFSPVIISIFVRKRSGALMRIRIRFKQNAWIPNKIWWQVRKTGDNATACEDEASGLLI
jgi:hypothetical protein